MQTDVPFEHIASTQLYFIPEMADPKVFYLAGNSENTTATLVLEYDYEKISGSRWIFYVYTTLRVAEIASMVISSKFSVKASENRLFNAQVLTAPAQFAINSVVSSFLARCREQGLECPELTNHTFDAFADQFGLQATENYFNFRKKDDLDNKSTMSIEALTISPGSDTNLAILGTFQIIDQVFFINTHFDTAHNLELLSDIIPKVKYYSLRQKSLEIQKKELQYNLMENIFLILLMEAALQLVLGDHLPYFEQALADKGMTGESINEYISYTSGMVTAIKNNFASSGTVITNLQTPCDWNSRVK